MKEARHDFNMLKMYRIQDMLEGKQGTILFDCSSKYAEIKTSRLVLHEGMPFDRS